jgi:hypothetical protein
VNSLPLPKSCAESRFVGKMFGEGKRSAAAAAAAGCCCCAAAW